MTPSQARRRPEKNPQRPKRDHYDRDSYRRAVEYACTKAGVPRWAPNQLRHSTATELRRDYGLDVAQAILGHKRLDVTQVYAELNRQKAIGVVASVG